MRKSNFALRLQPSLLAEGRKVAEAEGVALNQLINIALAEKLSALRTANYFAERAARANIPEALRILDRAGVGRSPIQGDELPDAAPKRRSQRMARKLWEPIWEYISELNNRGSLPAVHHYTSIKGALGILESGRIWFTERTHLNDPSELSHGIEIAKATLCQQGQTEEAIRLDEVVQRVFRDFCFFSASFSFERDDPPQWRNYADDGKGVVLSFKASAFGNPKAHIDLLMEDNATAVVCPMSYETASLEKVIKSIIRAWDGRDVKELCDYIFIISSMFKSNYWSAEREYRFFVHQSREKALRSPFYKTRERVGEIISYLDLPIQNWGSRTDFPIYRVCLGPAAPDGLEIQLRDFLCSKGIPIPEEAIRRSDSQLENDPRFLRRIEQSRRSLREDRGVGIEDVE
jgi:DUF2971 family protein